MQTHGKCSTTASSYHRCACRITTLPPLPLLPHLRYLYVQDNAIASLAPLHGAPALQLLNLSFNALGGAARVLRALAPAAGSLAELDLAGNPLEAEPECAATRCQAVPPVCCRAAYIC